MKLKTLKDLFPCVMKKRKCEDMLNPPYLCSGCSVRRKLKIEAVKWIKEYNLSYFGTFATFFDIIQEDLNKEDGK